MYYLKENHIIHRDLKPHNLFITKDKKIKIGDFGFATDTTETGLLNTLCGSPLYMAPEILMGQKYNYKADLWSLGIILYELIEKKLPFNAVNHIELINMVNKNQYTIENCDETETDLIKHLLVVEPEQRSTYEFFFNHQFFKGIKFCAEEKTEEHYVMEDEIDNYLLEYKINCINEIAILGDKMNNIESMILYCKYLRILSNFISYIDDEKKKNKCKNNFIFYLRKLEKFMKYYESEQYLQLQLRTAEEIIYVESINLLKTSTIIGILDLDSSNLLSVSLRLFDSLTLDEDKILTENDRKFITKIYNQATKIIETLHQSKNTDLNTDITFSGE